MTFVRSHIELPDHRGLICGFLLRPQLPAQQLDWETLTAALNSNDGAVWLHFNLVDARARKWIENCDLIPEAAKGMLLEAVPHIQLEVFDKGFISMLGDLHYEFDADPDSLGLLRMYVDCKCMISARSKPLKAVDRLRLVLLQGEQIESSLDLLVHFLQNANEIFSRVVLDLREVIDDMEDQILKGNLQEQRAELGTARRTLARLRRHLNGNRHALYQHLIPRLPSWCRENDVVELHRNIERLDTVTQDLELVQERARLLQEEMASRLQEMVNRNLYVLSIVTTVFLPVTLVTSIFGMNVGGLPWNQDSLGFLWSFLVMGCTLLATYVVLKQQRFL